MKKDLTNEILKIIEKEVAPDSQDYIAKQLNELFASLNPERIREVLQDHSTFNAKISSKSFIIDDEFDGIISDLCSGSQEKEITEDEVLGFAEHCRLEYEMGQCPKDDLPTLDEILGLDKFNLTKSQRNDCISVANFYGTEEAIKQAKLFEAKNQ